MNAFQALKRQGRAMLLCIFALGILLPACGNTTPTPLSSSCASFPKIAKKITYKVGFSQSGAEDNNPWRAAETASMLDEATKRGYNYLATDAKSSEAKQIADVNWLIAQKVDVLFIAPRSEKPLAQAVLAAHHACIPVFLLDRDVDHSIASPGQDYVTFLGSDFLNQGKRAADWLIAATHGKAKILELEGTVGASPAILRKQGFDTTIKSQPGVQLLDSISGNFTRTAGAKAFQMLLAAYPNVTAVYAHNDEMALGAIDVLKKAGKVPGKDVIIVSIDGERAGLEAIVTGELGATVETNPRFGPLAFHAFDQYVNGAHLPIWIKVQDRLFTNQNAAQAISASY